MADVNRLVFAILQFLESQTRNSQIGAEAVESIEVAIQCLETAYGISTSDTLIAEQLTTNRSLQEIFNTATGTTPTQPISATVSVNLMPEPPAVDEDVPVDVSTSAAAPAAEAPAAATATPQVSEETKAEAEKLKTEGNNLMKSERYREAVECYTKAVSLDSNNAVYYSNRAAAYSKLDDHTRAIQDCEKAVSIDPSYSKAYGRMGLAYTSLNQLEKAKEAYAKAVDLEPSNDSYQANLQIAEQKLREASLGGGGLPPGFPGFPGGGLPQFGGMGPSLGGLDIGSVLNNPGLMNMAAQFMQNPQMQQMMQSMMGQAMQPESSANPDGSSFANLLHVGQNLASQIQQTNPELIEQLRQMREQQPGGDATPDNSGNGNGQNGGSEGVTANQKMALIHHQPAKDSIPNVWCNFINPCHI
ncbi:small glutamine-rich tetratricopeptide repeat-containing protein beta-like [Amphiura filiformis]|uniref:small glutamine-rich tetratricopeptide repeat-containing protein beta-like n=1 Tax=Amphiura filiformis TaxID=82378 RepID=UPI003B20F766